MKTFEQYEATARHEPPFSNSTQWEIWQHNVCLGKGNPAKSCVNNADDDCPLITLSVLGLTPAEWTGRRGAYRCREYTTPGEQKRREDAALQKQIAESHYPMFTTTEEGNENP